MKNEMLEYWKLQLSINNYLRLSYPKSIDILKKTIKMAESGINPEIKCLLGDIGVLKNDLKTQNKDLIAARENLKFIQAQIKSYRMPLIDKAKDINKN